MNFADSIGLLAGALTTGAFIPQVLRTIRTRSAKDLSLGMLIFYVLGIAMWLAYGLVTMKWPLILTNAVTLLLAAILLACKLHCK